LVRKPGTISVRKMHQTAGRKECIFEKNYGRSPSQT
jgi:hypothetical protein